MIETISDPFSVNPEDRYRQTVFAPGAAVNLKHQLTTPRSFARNPKLDFPSYNDEMKQSSSKARRSIRTDQRAKAKEKEKKEDCNIF